MSQSSLSSRPLWQRYTWASRGWMKSIGWLYSCCASSNEDRTHRSIFWFQLRLLYGTWMQKVDWEISDLINNHQNQLTCWTQVEIIVRDLTMMMCWETCQCYILRPPPWYRQCCTCHTHHRSSGCGFSRSSRAWEIAMLYYVKLWRDLWKELTSCS